MKIMPNRMDRTYYKYQQELEAKVLEVLRSGWYVLGREVSLFEQEFAAYVGSKHCVGLANGLDALWIAFRVLNIGINDEVIVQANTYIASVMGVTINGATPVFVEPDSFYEIDTTKIEEKITNRTKAILVVHLYGQPANMGEIRKICDRYQLKLIEDCAQSHGANINGRMTGTFGDIGCFSFYPSKNLGAYGDGGAIVTDNQQIADDVAVFRNYGSEKRYYNRVVGTNSRLDEIQAGLLRVRLLHLDEQNEERIRLAEIYNKEIMNPLIELPQIREGAQSVWHQYVIRVKSRNQLIKYLEEREIGTIIHYPVPPHLSEAYSYLNYKEGAFPITEEYANEVLSIPFYNGLLPQEQKVVIDVLNQYGVE